MAAAKYIASLFCVHEYVAEMYIAAHMSLRRHIRTIDELTESNIGIAMDKILDHF